MQYFQFTTEIKEANALKPFIEKSCDEIDICLVPESSEFHKQALQKQENLESKEGELKKTGVMFGYC
jgi:hypothetical protein